MSDPSALLPCSTCVTITPVSVSFILRYFLSDGDCSSCRCTPREGRLGGGFSSMLGSSASSMPRRNLSMTGAGTM